MQTRVMGSGAHGTEAEPIASFCKDNTSVDCKLITVETEELHARQL
jgi:hypothetical protein